MNSSKNPADSERQNPKPSAPVGGEQTRTGEHFLQHFLAVEKLDQLHPHYKTVVLAAMAAFADYRVRRGAASSHPNVEAVSAKVHEQWMESKRLQGVPAPNNSAASSISPSEAQPEKRIRELRFGLERVIEKTKYDEFGTFEDVRNRIIQLCYEILADDLRMALSASSQTPPSFETLTRLLMACGQDEASAKAAIHRARSEGKLEITPNWTVQTPPSETPQDCEKWATRLLDGLPSDFFKLSKERVQAYVKNEFLEFRAALRFSGPHLGECPHQDKAIGVEGCICVVVRRSSGMGTPPNEDALLQAARKAAAINLVGETRCPECHWLLAESVDKGCVLGNCSYRPESLEEQTRRRLARQKWLEQTEIIRTCMREALTSGMAQEPCTRCGKSMTTTLVCNPCIDQIGREVTAEIKAEQPKLTSVTEGERDALEILRREHASMLPVWHELLKLLPPTEVPTTEKLIAIIQRRATAGVGAESRTDKDYAIEHGGYLADAAEAFVTAVNVRAVKVDEDDWQTADIDEYNDHLKALQSRIYDFRKRAARAESPPTAKGIVFNEKGLEICREIVRKEMERNPEATKEAFKVLGFNWKPCGPAGGEIA